MSESYVEQKVDFSLLDLDNNNPRFLNSFGDDYSEDDIIKHLLKNENAIELVKSISNAGRFHDDCHLWVVKNDKNRFIVKEGNRRLAALLALKNPEKYLDGKYNQFEVKQLPCLIYEDINILEERITRRHTKTDIKTWSRLAQATFVGSRIKEGACISDFKDLDLPNYTYLFRLFNFFEESKAIGYGDKLRKVLEEGKSALLERFFAPREITQQLGFSFDKLGNITILNKDTFKSSVNIFIEWFTKDKDITAHKVKQKNKQLYIDEIFKENGYQEAQMPIFGETKFDEISTSNNKSVEILVAQQEQLEPQQQSKEDFNSMDNGNEIKSSIPTEGSETDISKKKLVIRQQPHSSDRTTLFPSDFKLKIPRSRINNIYIELQGHSKNNLTESFAIMTRIFLELSVDYYGDKEISDYKNCREDKDKKFRLQARIIEVLKDLGGKDKIALDHHNAIKTSIESLKSPIKIEALN